MKIAIVLGRGVEGCGVTRCSIEFNKATPNSKIFATLDKKWSRRDTMVFDRDEFKCGDADEMHRVLKEINENFDAVLIYSVPSKTHPDECKENFIKLVQGINLPKGIVQLDHKMQSLSRNANFVEICRSVDVLMTHSLESDFTRWAVREDVDTPFKKMSLGFDYDGHRAKFWKPIGEQDSKTIRWIGRLSGWKGPNLMMDYHVQKMREQGFITVLEGLEASIGWAGILYEKGNKDGTPYYKPGDIVNHFRPQKELGEVKFQKEMYGTEKPDMGAYLYPPYNNVDAMERMSLSGFGSDLYHLKAHMYGNNIENCHAEIVASGSIPIFHKHFCDNVIHRVTGNPVSEDFITNGTIGLDHQSFHSNADMMEKLANDDGMRDEMREQAFEYWKAHSNADICASEIVENITLESFKGATYGYIGASDDMTVVSSTDTVSTDVVNNVDGVTTFIVPVDGKSLEEAKESIESYQKEIKFEDDNIDKDSDTVDYDDLLSQL